MNGSLNLRKRRREIPIFFAADDNYDKFMMVTMHSIIANASSKNHYSMYVLHCDITAESQARVKQMETANCSIHFVDVSDELKKVGKKLSLRDYYTATTYYRIFIPELFPEYDKVLYIDSDTVVREDIAKLYEYELGKNYIGAVRDQIVVQVDLYGDYTEMVLGISRGAYFNAGVVLINCELFRKKHMLKQFIDLLGTYTFVVAQDQDYLNILCKDKVLWLDPRWNAQMPGVLAFDEDKAKLVHYNLAAKPWHYKDCKMGAYFWEYAEQTDSYGELITILENFTKEDVAKDEHYGNNLQNLALSEIQNRNNYYRLFGNGEEMKLNRIEVLRRIDEYEKAGWFDKDVEEDPPGRELLPNEIEYIRKDMRSRIRTRYAFRIAHWFVDVLMKKQQFVVKEVIGSEQFQLLESGAVVTCNHFNAFDSFAIQYAYESSKVRKRKFYRVIKEANYTSFPGFYGFLMRNCNTLPLSSNKTTMKKFLKAVNKLLVEGNFVLVYPEQSMWWNYRKPKPLKKGAFTFAATAEVPVLPCFITMEDTEVMDGDGFPVQAYTIHVGEPIYPDKTKTKAENAEMMRQRNYEVWKAVYEETYQIPLEYKTESK